MASDNENVASGHRWGNSLTLCSCFCCVLGHKRDLGRNSFFSSWEGCCLPVIWEGCCLPVIYISQAEEESSKTVLRSVTGPQSERSELSHEAEGGLRALVLSWRNSTFLKTRIYAICWNLKCHAIKNRICKILLTVTAAVTAKIPETSYLRDFTRVEENCTEKNASHVRSKEKTCFSCLCIIRICLPSSVHRH